MALIKRSENVPLKRIKGSMWNPPNRTGEKEIKKLMDSMEKYGLIYPIILGKDGHIIDGHRRRACADRLGWKSIDAIRMETNGFMSEELYSMVNVTQRRFSGNDYLVVWFRNPNAVVEKERKRIEAGVADVGKDMIARLRDRGETMYTYERSKQIADYCGIKSTTTVLEWVMKHVGVLAVARKAMQNEYPPATIAKAIKADRPLKFTLDVA